MLIYGTRRPNDMCWYPRSKKISWRGLGVIGRIEALEYAEAQGWTVEKARGHAWGRLYCPYNDAECRCGEFCITSVWSTPRNPGNHARQLTRVVDNCTTRQRIQEAARKLAPAGSD